MADVEMEAIELEQAAKVRGHRTQPQGSWDYSLPVDVLLDTYLIVLTSPKIHFWGSHVSESVLV